MGYQERAVQAWSGRVSSFNTEVTFQKTGKEIKESINGVVAKLMTRTEKVKADIADICKKRELDPKEVIEAGSDEMAVETYSNKATNSLPQKSNALIRELQEDLQNLRRFGLMVESYTGDVESLQRIQKNIQDDRPFDLNFQELTNFGF